MKPVRHRRNPQLEPWMIVVPAALALGAAAYGITTLLAGRDQGLPPGTPPPQPFQGVQFAQGGRNPVWPLLTQHSKRGLVSYRDTAGNYHGNWSRRFGAPRGDRYHVGMDLYGYAGDPVVAMLDGTVVAAQSFHLGSDALFIDHGDFVMMYGEIEPNSWKRFGLEKGSRVNKGQQIARVDCMVGTVGDCESHMLHVEAYRPGTTKNKRWYRSKGAPTQILDPTLLLLRARGPTAA